LHPDKAGEGRLQAETAFQELNESYNLLRTTRARLLHLLALGGEPASPHVQAVPPVAAEFFAPVAELTKTADQLLKEKALAGSPMLKVQLLERSLECVDRIQEMQGRLRERIEGIDAELQSVGAGWRDSGAQLRAAAAALGFLERWNGQLQERAAALTF
jgi:hypothetical protein